MSGNTYYNDISSIHRPDNMPTHNGDSFSSPVMKRILRILLENGELKKSNLCSKAGLNYKVCARYVNFLAKLHWLELRQGNEQSVHIVISDDGIETLRKLESEIDKKADGSREPSFSSPTSFSARQTAQGQVQKANIGVNQRSAEDRKKKVVVIIDDDEGALVTYGAFLESDKSIEVRTFVSSNKGLEFITLHPNACDLIVLDIRMPGMSGLRVYQAIKALNPAIAVIFLSSLDAGPELTEMLADSRLGNRNFLRKPVSRTNFIETVRRAVA